LFVNKDHRWIGIDTELMIQAEQISKARGMNKLFLYSKPTESSVDFYMINGFLIDGLISKEIVRSLPGDIVMVKELDNV